MRQKDIEPGMDYAVRVRPRSWNNEGPTYRARVLKVGTRDPSQSDGELLRTVLVKWAADAPAYWKEKEAYVLSSQIRCSWEEFRAERNALQEQRREREAAAAAEDAEMRSRLAAALPAGVAIPAYTGKTLSRRSTMLFVAEELADLLEGVRADEAAKCNAEWAARARVGA